MTRVFRRVSGCPFHLSCDSRNGAKSNPGRGGEIAICNGDYLRLHPGIWAGQGFAGGFGQGQLERGGDGMRQLEPGVVEGRATAGKGRHPPGCGGHGGGFLDGSVFFHLPRPANASGLGGTKDPHGNGGIDRGKGGFLSRVSGAGVVLESNRRRDRGHFFLRWLGKYGVPVRPPAPGRGKPACRALRWRAFRRLKGAGERRRFISPAR